MRLAERFNSTVGHENRGFLSWSHGFVPKHAPLTRLSREFSAWDEVAAELPAMHRELTLRRRVAALPVLDASEDHLDTGELLRACALLAIVAHSYWYVEPKPPASLPESVQVPWQQVRARLERTQEVLTYTDLIVYNWRVRDAALPEPLVVENLSLLFPTIGNREERVFYLTQLEILARASEILRACVMAHEAVAEADEARLEGALQDITSRLDTIVSDSLLKLSPNPYSTTHVDPIVWAKTVAPLAVPFHPGLQGPSGTSSPIFSALDVFFGRTRNASFLGREITQLRHHFPRFWREFIDALGKVSVAEFVETTNNPSLTAAFGDALQRYAGEQGFLGRHRIKVYGFLELAFKVGRSVTIGGFSGVFKDRTWDQVDGELEASRNERLSKAPQMYQLARVVRVLPPPSDRSSGVRRVVLDVSGAATHCWVGSRCAILPENRAGVIDKTLLALEATGDEIIPLTDEWQRALLPRLGSSNVRALAIRELLRFGRIRPVTPRLAEALHARTQNSDLLEQIQMGATERWELWELLALVSSNGFSPRTLWLGSRGVVGDRLSRLIPPERARVYSVSSVERDAPDAFPKSIELTVGQLQYESEVVESAKKGASDGLKPLFAPERDGDRMRAGTASSFLIHALEDGRPVPFRLERPPRFRPPRDGSRPMVMFAAGTGVAPYRAFIQERTQMPGAGLCWLFLSLRSPAEFLLAAEFEPAVRAGILRLDVAFTREGGRVVFDEDGGLRVVRGGAPRRIQDLIVDSSVGGQLRRLVESKDRGGSEASIYVCGRSGFATTVLESLTRVFESGAEPGSGSNLLRHLTGGDRLVLELHTDAKPVTEETRWLSVSEVAQHNNPTAGYWILLDQVVYDLTEFAELHPGGRHIVHAYAGMDATHGYGRVHEGQPDVEAMREMYRIGRIRALSFEDYSAVVSGPRGPHRVSCRSVYRAWVRALHLIVEMQNTHAADLSLQTSQVSPRDAPLASNPYKLTRASETHLRVLQDCLNLLRAETLPALWEITQGLFAPDASTSWMRESLNLVHDGQRRRYVRALSNELIDDPTHWLGREALFTRLLTVAREEDARLLQELKSAVAHGVQVFERFEVETRSRGSAVLIATCRRLLSIVREYFERLHARWRRLCDAPPGYLGRTSSLWPEASVRRVYESELWVLEELPERRIVVLHRTPVAIPSLAVLAKHNDELLAALRDEHRHFGLVVDMRQAPLRNDAAFERTMARLRVAITSHFQRSVVLLDSALGELQVSRLERDEGRTTFVTRSATAAFQFAAGGR